MRDELLGDMRRVHHRRKQRRNAFTASVIVLLIGGLWLVRISPQTSPPYFAHSPSEPTPQEDDEARATTSPRIEIIDSSTPSRVTRIETDETILNRYRVSDMSLRHVTYLTDEQLVRELAAMGEPASVIRLPDGVLLVRAESHQSLRR